MSNPGEQKEQVFSYVKLWPKQGQFCSWKKSRSKAVDKLSNLPKLCILTNWRYIQHEFKLKLRTISKTYGIKYTKNSKHITFKNNIILHSVQKFIIYHNICHKFFLQNFRNKETKLSFMENLTNRIIWWKT